MAVISGAEVSSQCDFPSCVSDLVFVPGDPEVFFFNGFSSMCLGLAGTVPIFPGFGESFV